MERKEKVEMFFIRATKRPYWCESGECACIGCVNKFPYTKAEWVKMFPDEPFLTKEDVDNYNAKN